MKIYRTSDKIEIKVDQISVFISPLSFQQKMEIQDYMSKAAMGDMDSAMKAVRTAVKFCVKDIKGVTDQNNEPYKLEFQDDKHLSDNCVDDLLNMPVASKISAICTSLMGGVPEKILDHEGKELEGVSIVKSESKRAKK